jgi:hypothetical protein
VTGWGTPKATALIDALAADNSVDERNVVFEATQVNLAPSSSHTTVSQLIFGGTGTSQRIGDDYLLEIIPNANSGIAFDIPGPLTLDSKGHYSGLGTVSLFLNTSTIVNYSVRFVGNVERRHRRDVLVGEFYAVSSRGKILYQGDKPAFYGTFVA